MLSSNCLRELERLLVAEYGAILALPAGACHGITVYPAQLLAPYILDQLFFSHHLMHLFCHAQRINLM